MDSGQSRRRRIRIVAFAAMAVASSPCLGQSISWATNTQTTFNNPNAWIGGVVPGAASTAVFNTAGTSTVLFAGVLPTTANCTINQGTYTFAANGSITYSITNLLNMTGGTLNVSGTPFAPFTNGVRLDCGSITLSGNAQMFVNNIIGVVTTGSFIVGNSTNGALTVSQAGCFLHADNAAATCFIGRSGGTGTVTISNLATATFDGNLGIGDSANANSVGTFRQFFGGTVSLAGNLTIGNGGTVGQMGVLDLGGGCAFTQTGSGSITLGTDVNSIGSISIVNTSTLTSGTGGITINPTGSMAIGNFGTFVSNGPVNVSGGTLSSGGSGVFKLPAGGALNVTQGGFASLTGIPVENGQTYTVSDGTLNATTTIGSSGAGTIIVDGANARWTGGATLGDGGSGFAQITNGAVGTFSVLTRIGQSSSGTLQVILGGQLTATQGLAIGTSGIAGGAGTVSVAAGSSITETGLFNIGTTDNSAGTLLIPGGVFTANGNLNIRTTGTMIINGGNYTTTGGIFVNDGRLSFGPSGTINLGGPTFSMTNNASVSFSRPYDLPSGATLTIASGSDFVGSTILGIANDVATGTLLIDASSTTYSGSNIVAGFHGGAATLNLSNGAVGTLTLLDLANGTSGVNGSATLNVLSGAKLTIGTLNLVGSSTAGIPSLINLNSGTSQITITGINRTGIGSTTAVGPATLSISAGTFSLGTGSLDIRNNGHVLLTGGLLDSNGDIQITGGELNRTTGSLTLANNRFFTVQSGGIASVGSLSLPTGTSLNVLSAGDYVTTRGFDAGVGGVATITVDGAGSTMNTPIGGAINRWGFSSGSATVNFSNSAVGTLTAGVQLGDSNGSAVFTIQSGAAVQIGTLVIANSGSLSNGTFTVTGSGGTASFDPRPITLGGSNTAGATMNVLAGASVSGPGATLTLNATGTMNINDSSVVLGSVTFAGGHVNLTSGTLSYNGPVPIQLNGPFGDLWLGPTQFLSASGTTTIDPLRTLTLNGGTLSTSSITNNGNLQFLAGGLYITGAAGLSFISGGPFGSSFTLTANHTLSITNGGAVDSGATFSQSDGSFSAGSLTVAGTYVFDGGAVSIGALSLTSSGRMFVAGNQATVGTISNSGRIDLLGGAARIGGAGTITNLGLITGDGEIAKPLTNSAAAEIRATSGDTLFFSGASANNAGRINLVDGAVEVSAALANTGTISGRGSLFTAGLTNTATVSFSAGVSDVHGPVTNNSRVIVTGGSTTSFYDPVDTSVGSITVNTNSTVVFLANLIGQSKITGPGTKDFESSASGGPIATLLGDTIVGPSGIVNATFLHEDDVQVFGALTVAPNGSAASLSQVNALSIVGGRFDLSDNDLIAVSTPLQTVAGFIQSAFAGGNWTGVGLTSSAAQAAASSAHKTALGYASASSLGITIFDGQSVNGSSVLVRYTFSGDANLDGVVNALDFNALASSFGGSSTNWVQGDFNYDHATNTQDFTQLANNFNLVLPSLSLGSLVPEPSVLCLTLMAVVAMPRRRHSPFPRQALVSEW